MPIYEYRCQSCGHEAEILQKLSDPLLTECPACKDQTLKKKVSAAGFRLKGGGWYETDFKSGNKKNVAGDKSDSSGGSEGGKKDQSKNADSSASSSGETKSSTKSESKSTGTGDSSKSKS